MPTSMVSCRSLLSALITALAMVFAAAGNAQVPDGSLYGADSPILDSPVSREMLEHTLFDLEDLYRLARETRRLYAPLIPPGRSIILRQAPHPYPVPLDWEYFPGTFRQSLESRRGDVYSVPVYRLRLVEDRATRQLLVYGEDNALIQRINSPDEYDPFDWLRARYPGAFSSRYASPLLESLLAQYDPARVETLLELIPADAMIQYLYVMARVKGYARDLSEQAGGGLRGMRMDPTEGVRFSAIVAGTNGVQLTLAWPQAFTNRLDLYHATDLVEQDWRWLDGPLSTAGTTVLSWAGSPGPAGLNFHVLGNHDLDSDGDGFSDAFERLALKSDPADSTSRGVHLSGQVFYSGPESGEIYVQAVTGSVARWAKTWQSTLSAPGPYTNLVASRREYWVKAYMDLDGDRRYADWEPQGLHDAVSRFPTSDISGLDIVLEDQPSIWGAVDYTGAATGDIHVVAVPEYGWGSTYCAVIPWAYGQGPETGDVSYVSFPAAYAISGLPSGAYYLRAWVDADGSGAYTPGEPGGQLSAAPLAVSNRVTGCDFAIGLDIDADGMPDWWEMEHFGGATNAAALADADSDGLANLAEYQIGTDPNNPDTDGEGLPEGVEVFWGRITAWGFNNEGQCTVPSSFSNAVAVAAGYAHGLALLSDGTVTGWGYDSHGQATVPSSISNAAAISAGYRHSMVLHTGGTISAWGTDFNGQITIPPVVSNNAIAIAAGMHHSLALLSSGTVVGWGRNSDNQCTVPASVSNKATAITAGIYHSMALLTNGTVVAWGYNAFGQTTVPQSLSNVVAIAAGYNHSLALHVGGTVTGWGRNHRGQCAGASNIVGAVAIAAGLNHSLALLSDGTVALWGDNDYGQTNGLPSLRAATTIAANGYFNLALTGPIDPLDPDSDGDGLLDGPDLTVDDADPRYTAFVASGIVHADEGGYRTFRGELDAETDPLNPDSSADGIPDGWLVLNGLDPLDPTVGGQDSDQDGLTNYEEMIYGTDPDAADSDGDGIGDLDEILGGSAPLDAQDDANPYGAAVFTLSLGYGPPTGGGTGDGRAVLRLGGLAVPVSHYGPVQGLEIRLPRGRLHSLRLDGSRDRLGGALSASLDPAPGGGAALVVHDPDGVFGPPSGPSGYAEAFAAIPVVTINGLETGAVIHVQWPYSTNVIGGILPSELQGAYCYEASATTITPTCPSDGQAGFSADYPVCNTNWSDTVQLTVHPNTNGLSVTGTNMATATVYQWPPDGNSIRAAILDSQTNIAEELRIAKWEKSYASDTAVHGNFIERDDDSFFIEVFDWSKNGEDTVGALISTVNSPSSEVTLYSVPDDPGMFRSEALLLVSNLVDDELRGAGGLASLSNRTVRAALGDEVIVNYAAPAPCLSREARAGVSAHGAITVNIVNLIVNGNPCANAGVIATVTDWTTAAYAQVGVRVNFTYHEMEPPEGVDLTNGLRVVVSVREGRSTRLRYLWNEFHPDYTNTLNAATALTVRSDLNLLLAPSIRYVLRHRRHRLSSWTETINPHPIPGVGFFASDPSWTLYDGAPSFVFDYLNNMVVSTEASTHGLRIQSPGPNLSIISHELGHVLRNDGHPESGSSSDRNYNIMKPEFQTYETSENVFARKRFTASQELEMTNTISTMNWYKNE